ncbi:hypothetical protein L1987_43899 [Smallanthus sonchifolius]|uniref:Uncharacterized protein n=1 Tax=Smallanthus sonchifolius TaxID=185202 RepID=A0ACB9GMD8_9ASTR|nr:hypothetical protein L1987_43899 [Smallanthus sonchifolius]
MEINHFHFSDFVSLKKAENWISRVSFLQTNSLTPLPAVTSLLRRFQSAVTSLLRRSSIHCSDPVICSSDFSHASPCCHLSSPAISIRSHLSSPAFVNTLFR